MYSVCLLSKKAKELKEKDLFSEWKALADLITNDNRLTDTQWIKRQCMDSMDEWLNEMMDFERKCVNIYNSMCVWYGHIYGVA